ncbi:MAG: UDP-glucose 4-epimerase GalE [Clostridia bacterium]|nr:UDP-glucose 4-epimerase GalE [Clostridia bacterium]
MKILVTGGAGYIGSHTAVELLDSGHEIVVVDNYINSSPKVLDRVRELTGKDFESFECDIRDKKKLTEIFQKTKPDAVIHFAGLKSVGESVMKPLEYYDNNIYGTVVLLEVMRACGVKKIVFSSSATVYGGGNVPPLREDMPVGGTTNPYGTTKLHIEKILSDLYVADNLFSIVILRYFNPIGAHDSGRIGEAPNGLPNNLMPYITQVACGKLECLRVFGDDYPTPDGTCIRDYIHVVDLAKGHLAALNGCADKPGVHIFNLGTGVGYSVFDVINAFEKANGLKINYVVTGRRDGDLPVCYADATKANEVLGWRAERGIENMCLTSWNWQSKNPNGYDD